MIRDDYAGAGGWTEGLALLGLTDVGLEWDEAACATRAAAGHATIRCDLATYRPAFSDLDGYISSPPCQTFSAAGQGAGRGELDTLIAAIRAEAWVAADRLDDRTRHVIDAARVAVTSGARWICMEQVPPVLPVWRAVAHVLHRHGYSTWVGVVNSADYGVPQTRRRAVLIASRVRTVTCPPPTHAESPAPTLFGDPLAPWVSWGEALGFLLPAAMEQVRGRGMIERHGPRPPRAATEPAPTVRAGLGGIGTGLRIVAGNQPHAAVRESHEPSPTVAFGHAASDWLIDRRTNSKGPGGTRYPTAPVDSSRPAPTATAAAGGQWMLYPATTIAADPRMTARTPERVAAGDYDGTQPIRLTVAQAACLQSFRSDMPWQGTKTAVFRQIGNAVPPLLAAHIVAAATGLTMPTVESPSLTRAVA